MFIISLSEDSANTTLANDNIPRYYSQLRKAHQQRKVPELREEDLEEAFVRGGFLRIQRSYCFR